MNTEPKLTIKQELFIEHYMANGGNGVEAARSAGYKGDYQTLAVTANDNLNKPDIIFHLNKKKKDLRHQFAEKAQEAFETLVQLMNNPRVSPRVRLDACKDILDRAGYKPTDKVELSGSTVQETRVTKEIVTRARTLLAYNEEQPLPLPEPIDEE